MEIIDLVVALEQLTEYNKLAKVKVVGKIEKVLERPCNLYNNVTLMGNNGVFVEFHVFAIDLSSYKEKIDSMGINTDTYVFMVNGSLMLYVNKNLIQNEWYACEGIIRYGNKSKYPYLTMFKFVKDGADWQLDQNELLNVDTVVSQWFQTTAVYEYYTKSRYYNKVILPDEVNSLAKFYAEPLITSSVDNSRVNLNNQFYSNDHFKDISIFVPENREKIEENTILTEKYEYYNNKLVLAKKIRGEFILSLRNNFGISNNCNAYINYMLDAISNNLTHKTNSKTYTGRALVKDYLYKTFKKMSEENYMGVEAGQYLISSFSDVIDYLYKGKSVDITGSAWKLCFTAFGNPEKFYAYVSATLLGLSTETFMKIEEICYSQNLSFSKIMNENPYVLQCFGGLNFDDVETIALALNLVGKENLIKFRNIAILDSFISSSENSSTLFSKEFLSTNNIGLTLTEKKYEMCKTNGTYLSDFLLDSVKVFIKDINKNSVTVDLSYFKKEGYKYAQKLPMSYIENAIDDYTKIGLGVVLEPNYITSTKYLEKELYVFDYMYSLGKEETGYTDNEIDMYIDEYEQEVGFKLEPEQRKAVHLLKYKAAAIAGSAGSGKTTVSNCFTYVLEKLEDSVDFKFATPTGKAAKRLQEVVKRPVKTMCSMFKTFKETEGIFDVESTEELGYNSVYIFDENAMVTIDLLYSCLMKINKSRIYLFGDFHQLPPIGKGLPFKNLLRILPCQFLTVSKRASEGSGITLNSNYINEYSEPDNWRNLESGNDFILAPCNENRIVSNVVKLVKYYLGDRADIDITELCKEFGVDHLREIKGLTPNDIQVVSPLSKSTYDWGTNRLNLLLQPIFNKEKSRKNTYFYQSSKNASKIKYLIGDRVIHTNKNMYTMQWYSNYEDGELTKRYGFGINNGEVGTIVDCINTKLCVFYDEEEPLPDDFQYPENMRDDETYNDTNYYFLVVKYFDYLTDSDFYVLYRCEEFLEMDQTEGKVLKGEDLSMLSLFYAGTCHKMQGSQARLIIAPLGNLTFRGFVTRNMVYTIYTRAIDCVYTLGSVSNESNSMLSRARREVSEENVYTIGEYLCQTD